MDRRRHSGRKSRDGRAWAKSNVAGDGGGTGIGDGGSCQDREISYSWTKNYGKRSTALARTGCKSLMKRRSQGLSAHVLDSCSHRDRVSGIRCQGSRGRESGSLTDHVIGHGAGHTFNKECARSDGERVHLLVKSDLDLLVQGHASGARRKIDD